MKKKKLLYTLVMCLFMFSIVFIGGCSGFSFVDSSSQSPGGVTPTDPSDGGVPVQVTETLTSIQVTSLVNSGVLFNTFHWIGFNLVSQSTTSTDNLTINEKYDGSVYLREETKDEELIYGVYQANNMTFEQLEDEGTTYRLSNTIEESNMLGLKVESTFNKYVNLSNAIVTKTTTFSEVSYKFISENIADDIEMEMIFNLNAYDKLSDYSCKIYKNDELIFSESVVKSNLEVEKPAWFSYTNYQMILLSDEERTALLDSGTLYDVSHWGGYEKVDYYGGSHIEKTTYNKNSYGNCLIVNTTFTDDDKDYTTEYYRRGDSDDNCTYSIKYQESGDGVLYDKTTGALSSYITDMSNLINLIGYDDDISDRPVKISFNENGSFIYCFYWDIYDTIPDLIWTFDQSGSLQKFEKVINDDRPNFWNYSVSNYTKWIDDPEWFDINNYQDKELSKTEIDELIKSEVLCDDNFWTGCYYNEISYSNDAPELDILQIYSEETDKRVDSITCGDVTEKVYYYGSNVYRMYRENDQSAPIYTCEQNNSWRTTDYIPSEIFDGLEINLFVEKGQGSSYEIEATKDFLKYKFMFEMGFDGIDSLKISVYKNTVKIKDVWFSNVDGTIYDSVETPDWLDTDHYSYDEEKLGVTFVNELLANRVLYNNSNWSGYAKLQTDFVNNEATSVKETLYSCSTSKMVETIISISDSTAEYLYYVGYDRFSMYYEDLSLAPEYDVVQDTEWMPNDSQLVSIEDILINNHLEWTDTFKRTYGDGSYQYIIYDADMIESDYTCQLTWSFRSDDVLESFEIRFYEGEDLVQMVCYSNYAYPVTEPEWFYIRNYL